MDDRRVIRKEYMAQLACAPEGFEPLYSACRRAALALIQEGRLMTAALYRYNRQLYLYVESIGEEIAPECFMGALKEKLNPWPAGDGQVFWAEMTPVFWHAQPLSADEWREGRPRQRRRGRIAKLYPDKLTEYVYHHFALTQEGVFKGDKYMFISLYGDTLFSYFEEPRTSDNTTKTDVPSEAIRAWMAVDPDSHFAPLPGSNGQNFLLIDACFDVGEGDA